MFVQGWQPLNMLDTEVPKKTMRLCKFHSCTLSTCIGLWLELWSANTCMNRHRISKCLSMETGRLTNSTYILDIALVYLVDLKVSAIQWETTPHSCSTRNLFMFHQLIISWNVHKFFFLERRRRTALHYIKKKRGKIHFILYSNKKYIFSNKIKCAQN